MKYKCIAIINGTNEIKIGDIITKEDGDIQKWAIEQRPKCFEPILNTVPEEKEDKEEKTKKRGRRKS